MSLLDMYKWRMKTTRGKLWKWYIVIGTGLVLMFCTACASENPRSYDYREHHQCHDEKEIQICKGHSPRQLQCDCVVRRNIG